MDSQPVTVKQRRGAHYVTVEMSSKPFFLLPRNIETLEAHTVFTMFAVVTLSTG